MSDAFSISTDVVAASAAIAGLLLVYLGGVSTSYGSFRPEDQSAVLSAYRRRGWTGFVGVVLCLGATGSGLLAKAFLSEIFQFLGLILIFTGLLAAVATALWTILDIR